MSSTTQKAIGRFQGKGVLGTTGLATTYRAYDPTTERLLALKVLRPYFSGEPSMTLRFREMMEKVSKLEHPGIVRVLESGQEGQNLWIAREYVPHPSLKEYPLPLPNPGAATWIIRRLSEALEYAHRQRIVHGDIKPSNIFLTEDGSVLLSDFGTVLLAQDIHPLLKATLSIPLATHTAPEQSQGYPISPASDVYSLGILAYELLTGTVPFFSLDPSAVLAKQLTTEPSPPSTVNANLPREVDAVILKAISRRPEARQRSARELAEDLGKVLPEEPPSTYRQPQPVAPLHPQTQATTQTVQGEATTLFCPICQKPNLLTATYCTSCRAFLRGQPPATAEEVEAEAKRQQRQKRRSLILKGAFAAILLSLAGWVAYDYFGPPVRIPPPASDLSSQMSASQWPAPRGEPSNTGFIAEPGPLPQGHLKWQFQTNEALKTTPTVSQGTVYLTTLDRRLIALDSAAGDVRWQMDMPGPMDSSPTMAGDYLYIGLRNGQVVALRKDDGQTVWEYRTGGPVVTSPIVEDGVVYIGTGDSILYTLDALTGEKRWTYKTGCWIITPASVHRGLVLFASLDGKLRFVDARSGRKRFDYLVSMPAKGAVAIQDSTAFVGGANGRVYALDIFTRQLGIEKAVNSVWVQLYVWQVVPGPPKIKGLKWAALLPSRDAASSAPAVAGGRVFIGTRNGVLYAFDADTGEELWRFQAERAIEASPLVAGDTVYIGSNGGYVYALRASTGELLWQFTTGSAVTSAPALADGILYVVSEAGTLFALE